MIRRVLFDAVGWVLLLALVGWFVLSLASVVELAREVLL